MATSSRAVEISKLPDPPVDGDGGFYAGSAGGVAADGSGNGGSGPLGSDGSGLSDGDSGVWSDGGTSGSDDEDNVGDVPAAGSSSWASPSLRATATAWLEMSRESREAAEAAAKWKLRAQRDKAKRRRLEALVQVLRTEAATSKQRLLSRLERYARQVEELESRWAERTETLEDAVAVASRSNETTGMCCAPAVCMPVDI